MMANYTIREGEESDCEEIMKMIVELAEFEKMADQVNINAEVLKRDGFGPDRHFRCLVVESKATDTDGSTKTLMGYSLFYYIYSTWEGLCCYMEDLYIRPEFRGKGVGTALWVEVTKVALSKGCRRLHWAVLDWNTSAIELYKRRGGINLTEKEGWHVFRMTKSVMEDFVSKNEVKST